MLLLEGVQLFCRLVPSLAPMTVTVGSADLAVTTRLETDFSAGPIGERAAVVCGTNAGVGLNASHIRHRLSSLPRDFGQEPARSSFAVVSLWRQPRAHARLPRAARLKLTSRVDALRFSRPDGPGRTCHPTERRSSQGSSPEEIPTCA